MTETIETIPVQTEVPASSMTQASKDSFAHELIIQPRRGWIAMNWAELIHFRELLYFLVWRDIKVRYKQTILGAAWAVIPTIFNVIIMTVIFGGLANFRKDLPGNLPFSIWMFAGLLPWMLISAGITAGGASL